MQLDQPEVFVYFLPNRRLFFPTDERTPSNPTALCNLGVRQFVLGCENGRTGVEVLAIRDFLIHIASAPSAIRLIAALAWRARRRGARGRACGTRDAAVRTRPLSHRW